MIIYELFVDGKKTASFSRKHIAFHAINQMDIDDYTHLILYCDEYCDDGHSETGARRHIVTEQYSKELTTSKA
jgi:hypothetical protein